MKFKSVVLAVVFLATVSNAANFYTDRPSVLDARASDEVRRSAAAKLPDKLFNSILNFVAQLRILYSDKRRVYLGRDGELAYDMDYLAWLHSGRRGLEPVLINVSRLSSDSPELYAYLRDHGIVKGGPAILIDTGYNGTIVDKINVSMGAHRNALLPAHLMSSAHPKTPSSRVSTQPFYSHKRLSERLTKAQKEKFLDRVDEQVDTIEDLPHFTTTSTSISRNAATGLMDAYSEADPAGLERQQSVALQLIVRESLAEGSESMKRLQSLTDTLGAFLEKLRRGEIDEKSVHAAFAFTVDMRFDLFWADLRECVAKRTVDLDPIVVSRLWTLLPGGRPEYFDLEDDEERLLAELERQYYGDQPESSDFEPIFVEHILRFHTEQQLGDVPAARNAELAKFRKKVARGYVRFQDEKQRVGEKLGEGVRAEVFELGSEWILKVPFEADDMRYITVETQVSDFLERHFESYRIRVLPPLARGENGTYIVRKRVPREFLGEHIVESGRPLSDEQITALRRLFENTKRFARETGVGLDIKYDNLAWLDGDWVLFDTGPRTSYGPYAFSLDIDHFEQFFSLWRDDSPRKNGISIQQVIDSHRNGDCGAGLVRAARK